MKKGSTIRRRILANSLAVILLILGLTAVLFNVAARVWLEGDILRQLRMVAERAGETAAHQGVEVFSPPPPDGRKPEDENQDLHFYFMLDRSLRDPLSLLNADYLLLDAEGTPLQTPDTGLTDLQRAQRGAVLDAVTAQTPLADEGRLTVRKDGRRLLAIFRHVADQRMHGLGWIVTFTDTSKLMSLQWRVNALLLIVLLASSIAAALFSARAARKISSPFSRMNEHLGALANRAYDTRLQLPVDGELQELVDRINRLSEKLEQDDAVQRTFLQNASHEFRTPLMSIRGHAEGIRHGIVAPDEGVAVILEETARMTLLVNDLLYLSRLEAIGRTDPLEEVELGAMVAECRNRMEILARERGLTLSCVQPEHPVTVQAVPAQLSRALGNLVDNALRHAATTVTIRLETDTDEHRIRVEDDGPGIADEDLPHLFERFYKGRNGHFGLGLSIVRQVAERHGGGITAVNSGHGARFVLHLPHDAA